MENKIDNDLISARDFFSTQKLISNESLINDFSDMLLLVGKRYQSHQRVSRGFTFAFNPVANATTTFRFSLPSFNTITSPLNCKELFFGKLSGNISISAIALVPRFTITTTALINQSTFANVLKYDTNSPILTNLQEWFPTTNNNSFLNPIPMRKELNAELILTFILALGATFTGSVTIYIDGYLINCFDV